MKLIGQKRVCIQKITKWLPEKGIKLAFSKFLNYKGYVFPNVVRDGKPRIAVKKILPYNCDGSCWITFGYSDK
jgi:hypothetical protein